MGDAVDAQDIEEVTWWEAVIVAKFCDAHSNVVEESESSELHSSAR